MIDFSFGALGKGGFLFPGRRGKFFHCLYTLCLSIPKQGKSPLDGAEVCHQRGISGVFRPVFIG